MYHSAYIGYGVQGFRPIGPIYNTKHASKKQSLGRLLLLKSFLDGGVQFAITVASRVISKKTVSTLKEA